MDDTEIPVGIGENMINKKHIIINAALSFAVMLFAFLFLITGSLLAKAAASICFVAVGVINLIFTKKQLSDYKTFSLLLLGGLILAMSGDIAINYNFVVGAALFAAGHILFFAAQCKLCGREETSVIRDVVCGICLFAVNISILLFAPLEVRNAMTTAVCFIYAAIISAMAGKAVSNFIASRKKVFRIMLIGTLMFMLSDILLVLYVFMGRLEVIHYVCITLYYISELLIADSYIVLAVKTEE